MQPDIRILSISTEYVRAQVAATVNGATHDPTGDTVQFAFKAVGSAPAGGDWVSGSWETQTVGTQTLYFARCLVGPAGTTTLTAGFYIAWIKVTDSPEAPVRQVGVLEIYTA